MLQIALDRVRPFLSESAIDRAIENGRNALERLRDEESKKMDGLGWRRVARREDRSMVDEIKKRAGAIREDADVFVVCGIGGSYLGARAVIDALRPYYESEEYPEIVYAGHHLSGSYLESMIRYLEKPNRNGTRKSVYLNVISKSGSTLETAASFRMLRKWLHHQFEDADKRIFCTTSREGGVLNEFVQRDGYSKFIIPEDVGGRFSVLTPVGLFPIAVAGFDIDLLLDGARQEFEKNEQHPRLLLEYAAIRQLLYEERGKELDLLSTFEPKLHSLCRWLQQLFGESEGKQGRGVFPATAVYSTDLHSLGQMVQQGERNLMETFITVDKPLSEWTVESDGDSGELSYLDGKSFYEINKSALEGTMDAHFEGNVPVFSIKLQNLSEKSLGHFIYFYELFTAVYGYMLGINPFNQPGVEKYKNNIYQLLGKKQLKNSDA